MFAISFSVFQTTKKFPAGIFFYLTLLDYNFAHLEKVTVLLESNIYICLFLCPNRQGHWAPVMLKELLWLFCSSYFYFWMAYCFLQLHHININSGSSAVRGLVITFHCPNRKITYVSNKLKRGRSLLWISIQELELIDNKISMHIVKKITFWNNHWKSW